MAKYDHPVIAGLRTDGYTWHEIAGRLGADYESLRRSHSAWVARRADQPTETAHGGTVLQKWVRTEDEHGQKQTVHVKLPQGPMPEDAAGLFWEESQRAFEEWQPRKEPPPVWLPRTTNLCVVSMYDAHFGMKADGEAIGGGQSQDLKIISGEFEESADQLIALSRVYDPERYLIPLGHDLSHVNQYMGKAMTTRNGTEQDVDTRLWKIYRAVCESSIHLIDTARSTGKHVDVVMVPGNHDPDENYKLGEFLRAWYRHDPAVTITNTPTIHKYYGYGNNAFMLTHGEHYMKRAAAGNPILTFAAECPPEIWARGHNGGRYILSGHFHARRKGQYTPTSDVQEEGGIVTYVLPGLTATDEWHYRNGYRHNRAATLQVFRYEGGLHGHHEVNP
jgi:hypothetical protein